ncbi:MAG: hypothetical protein FWD48_10820 [Oscillospiraceae bacterium]|nr:hypothetical protein [Oscillospiraceae bacterium]
MKKVRTRIAGKNLLLAELIIVILVFAIAATGCVTLFAAAREDAQYSRDLTNAVIMAQNTAEIFKATGVLSGTSINDLWQDLILNENGDILTLNIKILKDTEVIYELTAAVLKEGAS